MTLQDPAPQTLMKVISCKCKGKCGAACGCRKAGLRCSIICQNCIGETCENVLVLQHLLENEDECDDFDLSPATLGEDSSSDSEIAKENTATENRQEDSESETDMPVPSKRKRKLI